MKSNKEIPRIRVHHGTCDFCHKEDTLVVHYNYDIQSKRDFRLCYRCYVKGQIISLVTDNFLTLEEAEVF